MIFMVFIDPLVETVMILFLTGFGVHQIFNGHPWLGGLAVAFALFMLYVNVCLAKWSILQDKHKDWFEDL